MNTEQQFPVGIIGVGAIGAGVARNLRRVSRGPVLVCARTPETSAMWAATSGFDVASPRRIGAGCDFVFLAVPGLGEVEGLVAGSEGILSDARPGTAIIDLTTSDPAATRRLADLAARRGVHYLDAGASGGPVAADEGKLVLTVGGSNEGYERCRPVLAAIAAKSYLVGPSGAGHTIKLLHNNLTYGHFLLACEAVQVARRAGIAPELAVEIFNNSNARSYATEVRFPRHILTGSYDGRARTSIVHKDLRLGAALNEGFGLSCGMIEAARDFVEAAVERGMGETDFTLLYRDFEDILHSMRPASAANLPGAPA